MARRTTSLTLPLDAGRPVSLQVPRGARHLATYLDYTADLVLHFEVADDVDETRRFLVVRHGDALPSSARHISSLQRSSAVGELEVLHVYELRGNPDHETEVRPFGDGRAWVSCSCEWRSSLYDTAAEADDAADEHASTQP